MLISVDAIGAEQPENPPARHIEADIVQRPLAARIDLGEALYPDRRIAHPERRIARGGQGGKIILGGAD
jgi:hypothetical protein